MERSLNSRYKSYQIKHEISHEISWGDHEMSLMWKKLYFFPVAQPLDLGLAVGDHQCCRMLSHSPRWSCKSCVQSTSSAERILDTLLLDESLHLKYCKERGCNKHLALHVKLSCLWTYDLGTWFCLYFHQAQIQLQITSDTSHGGPCVSACLPFAPWTVGLVARSSSSSKAGWTFCSFPFSSWRKNTQKRKKKREIERQKTVSVCYTLYHCSICHSHM